MLFSLIPLLWWSGFLNYSVCLYVSVSGSSIEDELDTENDDSAACDSFISFDVTIIMKTH